MDTQIDVIVHVDGIFICLVKRERCSRIGIAFGVGAGNNWIEIFFYSSSMSIPMRWTVQVCIEILLVYVGCFLSSPRPFFFNVENIFFFSASPKKLCTNREEKKRKRPNSFGIKDKQNTKPDSIKRFVKQKKIERKRKEIYSSKTPAECLLQK